ncbi:MAG: 3'(2'),5'-bisphosphate nucleotidase [Planctomycetes bacterium]|nr:3'(2'),5'-bisphosphate nucleotidase [Planctomycetota bacterium]
MKTDPSAYLDVGLAAGRLSAAICRRVQQERVVAGVPQSKAGNEPVTIADYASQAVILRAIAASFPRHAILAEENSAHLRAQADELVGRQVNRLVAEALAEEVSFDQLCAWIDHQGDPASRIRWAIDPIDGTKGFIRREQYAIAIGVLEEDVPVAGMLICPNLAVDAEAPAGPRGVIFAAARGAGAFQVPLDGGPEKRARASACADRARVRILGSVEASHGDPALLTALVAEGFGGGIVRVDSQVKYAALARGEAEVYLRPRSRPDWRDNVWDHAAGVAIAREAGAIASDVDGRPLDFRHGARLEENRGVLATNGPLHAEIVAAIARIEARR